MSKLHPYFVALCVVSCIASAVPVSAGKPTTATRQLLDAKPQLRAMFKGDRLIALYEALQMPEKTSRYRAMLPDGAS